MAKQEDNTEFDEYSRGMMAALTDALSLLASTGPQVTIAAADMPAPSAADRFTRGRRAGWDRAALIIRAAQASSLMSPPPPLRRDLPGTLP
ncbi:MAG: hypothetical protein P8Q97_18885 [Myxococcota bacterium]|jgi:CTP:molybdopterin cytidylyltransferase MocA|nr:hypothetical protein [Myxococcota bacterium]